MDMQAWISQQVMDAKNVNGTTAGQNMYKAYFGSRSAKLLYGKYQDGVDTILKTTTHPETGENYADCIVG